MLISALLRRWGRRFCAVVVTFALAIVGPATIAGAATSGYDAGQPGLVDIGASDISDQAAFAYDISTDFAEISNVGPAGSVAPVVKLAGVLTPAAGTPGVVYDGVGSFVAPRGTPGGLLSEASPGVYRSPGGLTYGPGSVQGHRTTHVLEHARPNPGKPNHSVFATSSDNLPGVADEVFGVIDEAWVARGAPLPNDPGVFVVPMGRTVGTAGETSLRIVVRPGTSEIITAYPT